MRTTLLIAILIAVCGGLIVITVKDTDDSENRPYAPSEIPAPEIESEENPVQTSSAKTLDLSHQDLTRTPDSVFKRTEIQKLDLSHNRLTGALQAEIRHLSELRVLDLSDNQFTGVPAEVGQLRHLEVLDLSNNQLTGLPYELGQLSNLKLLDLRGNDYSSIDLEVIRKSLPSSTDIQVD